MVILQRHVWSTLEGQRCAHAGATAVEPRFLEIDECAASDVHRRPSDDTPVARFERRRSRGKQMFGFARLAEQRERERGSRSANASVHALFQGALREGDHAGSERGERSDG